MVCFPTQQKCLPCDIYKFPVSSKTSYLYWWLIRSNRKVSYDIEVTMEILPLNLFFCYLILQVAGPYNLPPTAARRTLFIVYQTAVPYIAERIRFEYASSLIFRILQFISAPI